MFNHFYNVFLNFEVISFFPLFWPMIVKTCVLNFQILKTITMSQINLHFCNHWSLFWSHSCEEHPPFFWYVSNPPIEHQTPHLQSFFCNHPSQNIFYCIFFFFFFTIFKSERKYQFSNIFIIPCVNYNNFFLLIKYANFRLKLFLFNNKYRNRQFL